MDLIFNGFSKAFGMIAGLDSDLFTIAWLSIKVSVFAVLLSAIIGVPLGTWLAIGHFKGRKIFLAIANAGMGLPPVVVGLTVALMLWRSGPMGEFQLMYTPLAMIVAQTIIALPILIALTTSAIQSLDKQVGIETRTLGASSWQMVATLWKEARLGLLAAAMAAFGGVISEVGAVLIVGGNILGQTRVMTTAIVMESRMGHFDTAIAISILLLLLIFITNFILTFLQQRQNNG